MPSNADEDMEAKIEMMKTNDNLKILVHKVEDFLGNEDELKIPHLLAFLQSILEGVIFPENTACLYLTVQAAIAYHYTIDMRKILKEEKIFEEYLDKIENKVVAVVEFLEDIVHKEDGSKLLITKVDTFKIKCTDAINSYQKLRNDIEEKICDLVGKAKQEKVLKQLANTASVVGENKLLNAVWPLFLPASYLIAWSFGFGMPNMTYDKTLQVLESARQSGLEAEKALRTARTESELTRTDCLLYGIPDEKRLNKSLAKLIQHCAERPWSTSLVAARLFIAQNLTATPTQMQRKAFDSTFYQECNIFLQNLEDIQAAKDSDEKLRMLFDDKVFMNILKEALQSTEHVRKSTESQINEMSGLKAENDLWFKLSSVGLITIVGVALKTAHDSSSISAAFDSTPRNALIMISAFSFFQTLETKLAYNKSMENLHDIRMKALKLEKGLRGARMQVMLAKTQTFLDDDHAVALLELTDQPSLTSSNVI